MEKNKWQILDKNIEMGIIKVKKIFFVNIYSMSHRDKIAFIPSISPIPSKVFQFIDEHSNYCEEVISNINQVCFKTCVSTVMYV